MDGKHFCLKKLIRVHLFEQKMPPLPEILTYDNFNYWFKLGITKIDKEFHIFPFSLPFLIYAQSHHIVENSYITIAIESRELKITLKKSAN